MEAVGAQGVARSRFVILNALLRLRQICCDLRLLKLAPAAGAEAPPAPAPSGKLELFGELLDEALDGGHRALVFSQFVSMLSLIREQLDAAGIAYCYLDGSTVNRAEVVERFQRDAQVPVFLISLKAGGVGLNLTGADTVIHFDPWWNPAVEDQATDRAHRIGQTAGGDQLQTDHARHCRRQNPPTPAAQAGSHQSDLGRRRATGRSVELGGDSGVVCKLSKCSTLTAYDLRRNIFNFLNQAGKIRLGEAHSRGGNTMMPNVRRYVFVMRKRTSQSGILWMREVIIPE